MSEAAHILVVDDHPVARKTICALLRAQPDFDVICDATNGTEAVIQAMDLKPDVVVLDIGMPGMNGLDAARLIKKAAPSAEILFLSQHAELETIRQAFRVGGRGYVVKSDAGKELISAVHCAREEPVSERALCCTTLRRGMFL
jgi:DNA-binding NarL/FixJ family response regulator